MSRPTPHVCRVLREKLPVGGKLLLAVSGGIDSMVMLHACCQLQSELSLSLQVAHVDHGLRASSSEHSAFVEETCRQLDLPFHLQVAQYRDQGNVEAWGRSVRYQFFAELREKFDIDWTLTAHTANDVAETLLMRLVANKEPRSILEQDSRRRCIRPLLSVPRAQIEKYAEEQNVQYRQDETNDDPTFLRNRVRGVLLPLLEREFEPRAVEVLSLRAQAIADDIDALSSIAQHILNRLEELPRGSSQWLKALRRELEHESKSIQLYVAEAFVKPEMGFNIGRMHAERVVEVFMGVSSAAQLPTGVTLRRKGDGLEFIREN